MIILVVLAIQLLTLIGLGVVAVAIYRHASADDRHYSERLKGKTP